MDKYYGNYLGIVVTGGNEDPEKRGRVQVFIPHIMPTLYKGWNQEGKDRTINIVGTVEGTGLKKEEIDKLKLILPWAECAAPPIGAGPAGKYVAETGEFSAALHNVGSGKRDDGQSLPKMPYNSTTSAPNASYLDGTTNGALSQNLINASNGVNYNTGSSTMCAKNCFNIAVKSGLIDVNSTQFKQTASQFGISDTGNGYNSGANANQMASVYKSLGWTQVTGIKSQAEAPPNSLIVINDGQFGHNTFKLADGSFLWGDGLHEAPNAEVRKDSGNISVFIPPKDTIQKLFPDAKFNPDGTLSPDSTASPEVNPSGEQLPVDRNQKPDKTKETGNYDNAKQTTDDVALDSNALEVDPAYRAFLLSSPMKTMVILAGTNDATPGSGILPNQSAQNVVNMIKLGQAKGYNDFIVVPPNANDNGPRATYSNAISTAVDRYAGTVTGVNINIPPSSSMVYGSGGPEGLNHLPGSSLKSIAAIAGPGATYVGDSNAEALSSGLSGRSGYNLVPQSQVISYFGKSTSDIYSGVSAQLQGSSASAAPDTQTYPTRTFNVTNYSFGNAVGGPDKNQDANTNAGVGGYGNYQNLGPGAAASNSLPLGTVVYNTSTGEKAIIVDTPQQGINDSIDMWRDPTLYGNAPTGSTQFEILGKVDPSTLKTNDDIVQALGDYKGVLPDGKSAAEWLAAEKASPGTIAAATKSGEMIAGDSTSNALRQAKSAGQVAAKQPVIRHPTQFTTSAGPNTNYMPTGMFGYAREGQMVWCFFHEGNPLYPVYFAGSYGATEWANAYQHSSDGVGAGVPNTWKTVTKFDGGGFISAQSINDGVNNLTDEFTFETFGQNGSNYKFTKSATFATNRYDFKGYTRGDFHCIVDANRELRTEGDMNVVVGQDCIVTIGNWSQDALDSADKVQKIISDAMKTKKDTIESKGQQ
jgi:hypothetical protein